MKAQYTKGQRSSADLWTPLRGREARPAGARRPPQDQTPQPQQPGHNSHRRRKNSQKKKDHHQGPCGDPGAGRRDPGRGLRLSGPTIWTSPTKSDFDKSDALTNLELSQEQKRDKMEEGFLDHRHLRRGLRGQFHRQGKPVG